MSLGKTNPDRTYLADLIVDRLKKVQPEMEKEFRQSGRIASCMVDDLLPEALAMEIYHAFPSAGDMVALKSIRENKRIAAQMDRYHPLLEEIVFAFQDKRILRVCEAITGIYGMKPDELLYAGGISLMGNGDFLNPHLDNSHDKNRDHYRVLNLLYYVSPDWRFENGGNLELWDRGMRGTPRTIVSRFNRLVLMVTNRSSFHSVSKVVVPQPRCCVSNYYFSEQPADRHSYFHVTSFYGRPEEKLKRIELKVDRTLRNFIRKVTGKRIVETRHLYKKDNNSGDHQK